MTDHASPTHTISMEDPAEPDVATLIADAEAFSASLYPAESNHHLDADGLRSANLRFFVMRDADGRAVGTGAVRIFSGWAEIKSMWLTEGSRGRGHARRLLDRLIAAASDDGVLVLRLETGVANHAALALYRSAGFIERGPFAEHRPDPLSVFMERDDRTAAPSPQG